MMILVESIRQLLPLLQKFTLFSCSQVPLQGLLCLLCPFFSRYLLLQGSPPLLLLLPLPLILLSFEAFRYVRSLPRKALLFCRLLRR